MVTSFLTCILKVRKYFKPVFGNIPGQNFLIKMTGNPAFYIEWFHLCSLSCEQSEQYLYPNYRFNENNQNSLPYPK